MLFESIKDRAGSGEYSEIEVLYKGDWCKISFDDTTLDAQSLNLHKIKIMKIGNMYLVNFYNKSTCISATTTHSIKLDINKKEKKKDLFSHLG